MIGENEPIRDVALGSALRELDVPEHREAFFAELEEQLALEWRRAHRGRLGRRGRRTRRSIALVCAAAIAALFLTIGLSYLRGGSDVASAAALRARLLTTLTETRTIRGELVYRALDVRSNETVTTRQRFAADAAGDLRVTDLGDVGDVAYDARHGIERAVTTSASLGSGRFFARRSGLAPGPPDQGPSDFLLNRELGAVVRALAVAHDARVEEASLDGHAVWRLVTALEPNTIFPDADQLEVVVDQASGFPLRVATKLGGAFRSEMRVERLALHEGLPSNEFTLDFPADAQVLRTNEGFRRVELADVSGIVGYRPLVPSDVPTGFHLAAVAVAERATATGPGAANPPSRDVVALAYRRGLEQFVVTTRLRGRGSWQDPFATEGIRLVSEPIDVGGVLAGPNTRLVIDPRVVPHLWAKTDRLVVTVAGDLSRDELLAVAESLR